MARLQKAPGFFVLRLLHAIDTMLACKNVIFAPHQDTSK